jgi:hypothetical protein
MSQIPIIALDVSNEDRFGTVIIRSSCYSIKMSAIFRTDEERDAVFALFPKSYRARSTRLHYARGIGEVRLTHPMIQIEAKLSADEVNGGLNETGEVRLAKVTKKLLIAGVPMAHQLVGRDCLSVEEVEKVLFPE